MTDRLLVLLRHGQSEWNFANRFTGTRDVDLTETGVAEARAAGRRLKEHGVAFDAAFSSALRRAWRTLDLVLAETDQAIPVVRDHRLNERDYGILTGLDKDAARDRWGTAQIDIWRRAYDTAPPGGESLADVTARVLPFYNETILPRVLGGSRILIVAHEHSLRALVMALERLDRTQIAKRELATAIPVVYRLDADATVLEKRELTV